jgi:hypothetical protein
MKYRVIGIRRSNGQEVDQVVDAITAANAAVMAQQAGVVVTGVFDEEGTACPFPLVNIGPESSSGPDQGARYERPEKWSPGVAAILSFFWPGLGQMYKGQVLNGLAWMMVTFFGYFLLIVPGFILHLFCIAGAYSGDPTRRA